MKLEIEIEGLHCKAETDYYPGNIDKDDQEVIKAKIFTSLCQEVRYLATKLIETKYKTTK